ncbi:MAG: hypothetical protein ABI616_15780 [Pseudomonadota bacterium]
MSNAVQREVKYSEEVIRIPARNAQGGACVILERITHGRQVHTDGSLGEPEVVNRRFDLRTGESVNHLGNDVYELDGTGDRLQACPSIRARN